VFGGAEQGFSGIKQKAGEAVEFLKFFKEVDAQVPDGLNVHIVMDNYATHKTPRIKAWLARRPIIMSTHADVRILDQSG
jgi:hypothetical protein